MQPNFSTLGIYDLPEPTRSGRVVVAASGRCVWEDLARVGGEHDTMAVNDAIAYYPTALTHAYSEHTELLPFWLARCKSKPLVHTATELLPHETYTKWPWPRHGSSSLGAVYTALALGYEEVILCGVPLDNSGHFYDPPWTPTNFLKEVPNMQYWSNAARNIFQGRVTSMSGRTRELLG